MKTINDQIQSTFQTIKNYASDAKYLLVVQSLIGNLDLSDIQYVTVSGYESQITCEFNLDQEKSDSKFVHLLAQVLGVNFSKKKVWVE